MTRKIDGFYRRYGKRLLDVVGAVVASAVVLPVVALASIVVVLDSGWPPFYVAERRGLDGRRIRVLKLRTMATGAEAAGRGISSSDDSRITRFGRTLRRWKIDELPQVLNVLRGDMSIVGPRPQSPDVAESPEREPLIYSVRPGLSDWSSIVLNDEGHVLSGADDIESFYESRIRPMKRDLARDYARHVGFRVDLLIVVQTAWVLLISRILGRRPTLRLWHAPGPNRTVETALRSTRPEPLPEQIARDSRIQVK